MDDVYFGVLRVWHLLTSNAKVVVAVLGVVAVVATVTTVFAAPAQDTGASSPEGDSVPAGVAPVVEAEVGVVDGTEILTIGDVSSPGILPSSPFYPVKVVVREVSLAFTFDPVSKAERCLRYANEDLLAIYELYGTNEVLASSQCGDYEDNFWNSILWVAKAGREGRDVQMALARLRSSHDSHRLALADVLSVVDEMNVAVAGGAGVNGGAMRDAVIQAAAATSAELEFAILALQGQQEAARFHAKLQNDFSWGDREVWLQIENRLGMPAEQAIALSAAIGDEGAGSVVSGTPIITSMHVDSFHVEPGESCTITCNATDFENEPLTYQWLAAEGEIEGEGAVVTWTAPGEVGEYRISAVVSDAAGNQSSKAVTVVVGDPQDEEENGGDGGPFSIESFEVVPVGHDMLKRPALGLNEWTIFQGRDAEITCVVDGDTSGLEYDWDCDVGEVQGDGETAMWEAPGHACYAHVTVVVRGANGETEEETVTFRVSTCAPCF